MLVQSITNSSPCVVTTTTYHGYLSGLVVNFVFPAPVGMFQLQQGDYDIMVLSSDSFAIPIDSTNFTPFNNNTSNPAQVVPIGETNPDFANSFQNISQGLNE
jgi:hypothetical protein